MLLSALTRLPVPAWLKPGNTCLLCDERTDHDISGLCSPCEAELPWLSHRCTICALPLTNVGLTCGSCLKRPPSFTCVETPWLYAFPVDSLITRFKHQNKLPFGRLLATLLAQHLQYAFNEGQQRPDLLLPVPLAVARQRRRGFNQAELLCLWLSKALAIPTEAHWLQRVIDTPAQQALDAKTRRRNLRHAFHLSPDASINGLHVALVDDVVTTGATAETLAKLLTRAGAARVDVYSLARTPAPGD